LLLHGPRWDDEPQAVRLETVIGGENVALIQSDEGFHVEKMD
jgi:hypothetical protein